MWCYLHHIFFTRYKWNVSSNVKGSFCAVAKKISEIFKKLILIHIDSFLDLKLLRCMINKYLGRYFGIGGSCTSFHITMLYFSLFFRIFKFSNHHLLSCDSLFCKNLKFRHATMWKKKCRLIAELNQKI